MFRIYKDPIDIVDWRWNWSRWLALRGNDVISSATFDVPVGLTKESQHNTTKTATLKISGGTLGQTYDIPCRMTTLGGRYKQWTARLLVRNE